MPRRRRSRLPPPPTAPTWSSSAAASWASRPRARCSGGGPTCASSSLERERALAAHQSGHNSGVVHAGLYYAPGSLKARLCREGKAALEAYCAERGIPVQRVGKLVVALSKDELPRFESLEAQCPGERGRGTRDGRAGADPGARAACEGIRGLWSPATGIVDFRAVALAYRRRHPGRRRLDRDGPGRDRPRASAATASSSPPIGASRRRLRRRVRRPVVGPRGGHDRRHGRRADRPVPRRLLHAHARCAGARPRADLPGPRPALPVPRHPLHRAATTAPSGPARTPSSPSPATVTGATTSTSARSSPIARHSRLPASGSHGSGGRASPSSGATSRSGRSRDELRRYVPALRNDQLRFGPSAFGPRRSTPTGRWSTTSGSAAAGASSTSGTRRRPGATASLAIARVLADELETRLAA